MRPSLYLKDDDFIESFTNGNFVTLTNVSKKEIEDIIKFEIKPLNVSVHSFNRDIRNILFGNKRNYTGVENLIKLDSRGITTNIQIVLCPGINDGKDLENTLDRLINRFKNVNSIGIVPVGITKYNKETKLQAFNKNSSDALVKFIEEYKYLNRSNKKSSIINLSDEFYTISKKRFPDPMTYGGFEQIQNGIGKTADFINDIKKYSQNYSGINSSVEKNNILIVTSEYGREVFYSISDILLRFKKDLLGFKKRSIEFLTVKNDFFGGNVKVTGLLTGTDIMRKLKRIDIGKYDAILIPSVIFNGDGVTLDDYRPEDFNRISNKIRFIKDNGLSFVKSITG
jgi:putative radical SAM enzyme (TIGR03279 family)